MSRKSVIEGFSVGAGFLAVFAVLVWAGKELIVGYGNQAYNEFFQVILGSAIAALALCAILTWADGRF